MAIGTSLPALDLQNLANQLLGNSGPGNASERSRTVGRPGHPGRHLGDQIHLSDEARNILSSLESGFASQRQQDAQFASQQLQAVQEQIEFASALLGAASDEQQGIILDLINDIIGGLSEAGGAIGDLFGGGGRLEGLFNGASQGGGDLSVSYAESLNVEFNFTRISERTESIEVSQGDDGSVTIERNVTETEIVVTELNIEREQTLVVQQNDDGDRGRGHGRGRGQGNSDLRGLVNEFRDTIRQFANLISDVQDRFGGGNDLAETLTNLVRELLQGQEESNDQDGSPLLVDIAA